MVRMNCPETRLILLLPILLGIAACSPGEAPTNAPVATTAQPENTPRTVFVQLFEWGWADIGRECEAFLGPAGYAAVQVSPPQEHIPGPEWWTRYQPVSYLLESRGGTREEFAEMLAYLGDVTSGADPIEVAQAAEHALFDPNPKRRYLVVPNQEEAGWTINKQIEELAQLNQDHKYSYTRDQLVEMLDAALIANP